MRPLRGRRRGAARAAAPRGRIPRPHGRAGRSAGRRRSLLASRISRYATLIPYASNRSSEHLQPFPCGIFLPDSIWSWPRDSAGFWNGHTELLRSVGACSSHRVGRNTFRAGGPRGTQDILTIQPSSGWPERHLVCAPPKTNQLSRV